jgi:hypothetical protein
MATDVILRGVDAIVAMDVAKDDESITHDIRDSASESAKLVVPSLTSSIKGVLGGDAR